jgi:hypothetical protein
MDFRAGLNALEEGKLFVPARNLAPNSSVMQAIGWSLYHLSSIEFHC